MSYTIKKSNLELALESATEYGSTLGLPHVDKVVAGGLFDRSSLNTEFGITISDGNSEHSIEIGVNVLDDGTCIVLT